MFNLELAKAGLNLPGLISKTEMRDQIPSKYSSGSGWVNNQSSSIFLPSHYIIILIDIKSNQIK